MSEHTTTAVVATRGRRLTWQMKPPARKAWLLAHVAVSVGWFGGGYAMLVMGIVAMTSAGTPLRPAAYELMHLSDTAIMIPGSLGALITGLVVALYSKWRVLHHWWVVIKLLLTVGAMVFAYAYIAQNVKTALEATLANPAADVERIAESVISGNVVMLLALLATTLLSIFKPWGRTAYGRRALAGRRPVRRS
ncbi:hypothetical protein [Kutzneria chonburiensis]|uniref:DUF2269 domain-containing protein n=1 Tax=Kutzneria chonburiensis TaxID=1483604 RepID=A0ABV6MS84_9PSEU|nr:hypothetical protein [Kutzneria chonburiensis]